MKVTLRLKRKGKVIQTFVGKLTEKNISPDCGEPGCPALETGSCDSCYTLDEAVEEYENQRKMWSSMMGRYPYEVIKKSCKTCFFADKTGAPDIGPHSQCLYCTHLSHWTRKAY